MLIERDEALSRLNIALTAARSGSGSCVIVSGEAGAGKTALINWFASSVSGYKICRGNSEALFTPRPLGPLRDMGAGLDPRVAALLDQFAPQDTIFPVVLAALQDSKQTPILIFEDAHWADNATLDLLKYLGRRIAYLRALVIVSVRSDEMSADHSLTQVLGDLPAESTRRIMLEPLSVEGVARLTRLTMDQARDVHRICGGNPFFATELIASQPLVFDKAPASVRDAVWARLQRLPEAQRMLLEAISIEPAGVEPWLAEALVGGAIETHLEDCVERGLLVRHAGGRHTFRHEIARAATMERLKPSAVKQRHKAAYAALSARPGVALSRLIHHASGAGFGDVVLDLAPRAAQEAIRVGAHREAAGYLAAALIHADQAPPEIAAQLHEDWAVEASLSMKEDDRVFAAAERASQLWHKAGRPDKVASTQRLLSRLYWIRGDSPRAVRYIEAALKAFEGIEPTRDLGMIYSNRAQLFMFNDQFEEAAFWARKAIALAEQMGDDETRIHALNNLGGSLLFAGNPAGKPFMQESLDLALEHGFHDHASRAYHNFIEYAVLAKEYELAEKLISAGLAYSNHHDLDWSVLMLVGTQALLKLDQGRLEEAEAIAETVVRRATYAYVAKIPAEMALSRARLRLGRDGSREHLSQLMETAMTIGEQQHIVPARMALIECAWLEGDLADARTHLEKFAALNLGGLDSWDLGAFATWWKRCGMEGAFPGDVSRIAAPRAAEISGEIVHAHDLWQALGLPYEAALALLSSPETIADAIPILERIGAAPAAALGRRMGRELGLSLHSVRPVRGPYKQSRQHPLGLTGRQAEVFRHLAEGMSNQQIADRLDCSPRTVENHVTAILGKMNASNRLDVMLRLRNEPWLVG